MQTFYIYCCYLLYLLRIIALRIKGQKYCRIYKCYDLGVKTVNWEIKRESFLQHRCTEVKQQESRWDGRLFRYWQTTKSLEFIQGGANQNWRHTFFYGRSYHYDFTSCPNETGELQLPLEYAGTLVRYLAMSLRAFKGRTLMTLRAGLAAKTCSSLVNGLMPFRLGVAGLWMTMLFIRPGKAKAPGPFLPTAALIWPERASNTDATCLRESCDNWKEEIIVAKRNYSWRWSSFVCSEKCESKKQKVDDFAAYF